MHLKAKITGRVQMVRYRLFVKKNADKLYILGSVQKLPDGRVLVDAYGEKFNLVDFLGILNKGSFLSRVDDIEQIWDNMEYEGEKEFKIIR